MKRNLEYLINKKHKIRQFFMNYSSIHLIVFCSLFLAWLFAIVDIFYIKTIQNNLNNNIFYFLNNTYFFNKATDQVIFLFNPFAITMTIFIAISILLEIFVWLNNLLTSLYLIKLYGFKIIFDNPYLNQLLLFFIIFYGIIWATVNPNYYEINNSFSFYTHLNNSYHFDDAFVAYVFFFTLFNYYLMFITLFIANNEQKHWIIKGELSMKKVVIFGITGSVGNQTIDVINHMNSGISIVGCSFNLNTNKMKEIYNNNKSIEYIYSKNNPIYNNVSSYEELITKAKPDLIINAVSGIAGVEISFLAIKHKIDMVLANKESLVAAGSLLMKEAKQNQVKIYPADSEHACFKAIIDAYKDENIQELLITCSGGAFYDYEENKLHSITYNDAIKHPTWTMGNKISIDSATLMNKTFEIIEAYWLFNTTKIKTIIHKQSIVHAMVQLKNNATAMYASNPDMKLPIQLALNEFKYDKPILQELSFNNLNLTFNEVDLAKYPNLDLPRLYFEKYSNTTFGTIITVLDEIAITKFKNNEIKFNEIVPFILNNYENFGIEELKSFDQIQELTNKIKTFYNLQ
ncbi:MAG: hypothetical protein IIT97_00345 [Mycoplasmataceae bacterium]|nr:hypothetical protein [Mycoplasmataceae bacterium]